MSSTRVTRKTKETDISIELCINDSNERQEIDINTGKKESIEKLKEWCVCSLP
jgi:imidazoleglycerol phosphate dehydratase HisB